MTEFSINLIPNCLKKDSLRFEEIITLESNNKKHIQKEVFINLEPQTIFSIIKNFDNLFDKYNFSSFKSKNSIKQISKEHQLNNYSDILKMVVEIPLFSNYIMLSHELKFVRYYTFSQINKSYYIIFKIFKVQNNNQVNLAKGTIIIPTLESKVIISLSKKSNNNIPFEQILNVFAEMISLVNKLYTEDDLNKISELNKIETRANSIGDITIDNIAFIEHLETKYESAREETSERDEIIDYIGLDLDELNGTTNKGSPVKSYSERQISVSLIKIENKQKSIEEEILQEDFKFINDSKYSEIKKMTIEKLESLNYKTQYEELNAAIEDHFEKGYFSSNEIIRYIYGWRGDVQNAKKAMIELDKWRKSFKPESLDYDNFKNSKCNLRELLDIVGLDKYGRVILLLKAKNLNPNTLDLDEFIKYLIFIMTKATTLMKVNVDKVLMVIDIAGAGTNNFSMAHLNTIKETTGKYFVERNAAMIIINKGFFFGVMWSVISPFLDERIKKKLIVLDNSNKKEISEMFGENKGILN